ncbi:hypothetical protein ACE1OA_34830 [Streptomyces sp. JL2001]|uniref:hypothetical protein n=1 Tax=Streptomyces sp. JL2001 TaxID=3342488 RepID=UPI003D809018
MEELLPPLPRMGRTTSHPLLSDPVRGLVARNEVTVIRTEMATFHLPATSSQDVEERYLMDGEETSSETVALHIDSTIRLDPEPA